MPSATFLRSLATSASSAGSRDNRAALKMSLTGWCTVGACDNSPASASDAGGLAISRRNEAAAGIVMLGRGIRPLQLLRLRHAAVPSFTRFRQRLLDDRG